MIICVKNIFYTTCLTQQTKHFSVIYENPIGNKMQNTYVTWSNFPIYPNDLLCVIQHESVYSRLKITRLMISYIAFCAITDMNILWEYNGN